MKRKLLSLILSIIMVFSLIPASAFAAYTKPADGYELVWGENFDEEYSSDDFSENEEIGLNATTAMPDGWSSDESDNNNSYVVRTEDGNNALFLNGKTAKATIVDSSKFDTYLGQEYYLTYDYWTVEGKSPKVACTLFGGGNDSGLVSLASPTTNVQNKKVICAFREGETVKIRFSLKETGSNDDVVFIDNIALWKPLGQETATKYDLWVGGTRVTSQNAGNILASNYTNNGKISFDAESNTLTLNGADLYEDLYYAAGGTWYSIYGTLPELNVEIAGNSTLGQNDVNTYGIDDYCGIYNKGTLNIKGSETLTINTGLGREGDSRGVWAEGGIIVLGDVTVKITGSMSHAGDYRGFYSPGTVEFTGDSHAEVDFSKVGSHAFGVSASKVIVSENADVNIKSMNNGIAYADGSSTSFKQTGGSVTIDVDNEGIYMEAFEMGGGTLNVTSSKTALHTIDTLKFSGGTTELFGAEKAINPGAAEFDFSAIKYYDLYAGESSSSATALTEVPTGADGIGAYKYYRIKKTTPPLENYDLWVGATQVTSENKDDILPENPGSVKYDPETKTLTLNNATVIGGAERTYNEEKSFAGIYSEIDELTIKLEGTSGNRVSVDKSATVSQDYAFAIQSTGKVKFAGSGQIFVEIPQVDFETIGGANVGMTAEEGITIGENAIVCVTTEEANPGKNVTYVFGIMSNGACVVGENSQLVLTTCAEEQYRTGKYFLAAETFGFEVKDSANVTVTSDLIGIQTDSDPYSQSGGTVVTNGTLVGLTPTGMKMTGGSLKATGDTLGISMIQGATVFEISGGTIEATGGTQAINPNNALPDVSNFAGMKVLAGESKDTAAPIADLPQTAEEYTYKYLKIYSGAEEPEVKYNLWIEGKQVTNKNAANILGDGKVSFNANTNTLTLNGAIITEKAQVGFASTWPWASIHSWLPELKIKLKGESTIGAPSDDELNKKYIGYRGIYAKGALTFLGDGTLNVNMAPEWRFVYGIDAEGLMTIGNNVTIKTVHTATAGTSHETIYAEGGLTICDNAVVDFTLKKGNGYYAGLEGISASGTITISDNAKVKIESDGRCFYQTSSGKEADYVQTGGEVNVKSYNDCFYIKDFSLIDGKLTAESTIGNAIDLFGSKLSFTGGRAELTGKTAFDVYEDSINMTFSGVVVKAGNDKDSARIIDVPANIAELTAHNYYKIEKGTAPVGYNLWVGSTQVTSANLNNVLGDSTATVKFDPDTNTLTLEDAKIASYHKKLLSSPGATEEVYGGFQIYSGYIDLTIELKGTNEITGRSLAGNFFDKYFGIYSKQDITFKGDGTLSLTYPTVFEYAVGLSSENGDLTFEGSPNVILSINENMGSVNDLISIFGNNITFKDDVSVEIVTRLNEALGLNVKNAAILPTNKVEVSGNAKLIAESSQYGIYCPGSGEEHKYVQTGGNVKIAAKEQAVYTYDFTQEGGYLLASSVNTNAIFANSVKITNGSGELYSTKGTIKTSNGPDFSGYERLKLMGGEDKATAQEVKDYSDTFEYFSYGKKDTALKLYDIWVSGIRVTSDNAEDVLSDGKVKFDAATNTLTLNGATISNGREEISSDDGNICIGIDSALEDLNVVLEGENIIAYGGSKDFDTYYGIVTSGNIKFSGNGTLNIKALETDRKGVGIYSTGKVTVTDSAVLKFTGPDSMSNDWKYKGVLADNVEISGKAKIDINVKQPEGLTGSSDLTGIEFKENFEISGTSEIKIDIEGEGISFADINAMASLIVKGGKLDISGKNIGIFVYNFEQTGGTVNIHDSDRGAWLGGIFKITGGIFEAEGMLHAMLAGPENIDLSGYKNIKILLGKTKAAAKEVDKLPTTVSDLETYGYLKIYEGKNSGGNGGGGNGGGGGISVPANSTETKPENMEKKLPFKDVFETDSYYDAVYSLWDKGLISGITNELFGPNVEISRGMIVAILWRAEGSPTAVGENIFTDVLPGSYYEKAAIWATSKGIISGYGDGTFGPNDIITTEQMVTILYYYAKYKGMDLSVGENTNILSYDDVIQMGEYAFTPMQWACGAGVYDGKDAKLMPKVKLTRAEVTEMLYRVTK